MKSRPALSGLFPPDCNVEVKEVGDGNVNLVYIVEDKDNRD
jgi:5-methylthioribose kinase